jgi:hypothetical protein
VLAVLGVVLLAGCQVDTAVEVRAGAGGRGQVRATVTLDRAAAAQVPDLARQQRVEDLQQAGWRVQGPKTRDDGGMELRAAKGFSSPADATRVVEELAGADGPFRQFRLGRRRSLLKTRTSFSGTVDLSAGLDGFADPALRQRLGGSVVDAAALERQLGISLPQVFRFKVVADLPGHVKGNAVGGGRVWEPKLGQTLTLEATAEQWNLASLAFGAVAVASAVALAVVLLRRVGLFAPG